LDFLGIDARTLGGGLGALVALLALAYRGWQLVKQDSRGDKVDDRVNQFTSQLSVQLDKAILRADALQAAYNQLQSQYADAIAKLAAAQARAEFLAAENQQLRTDLGNVRDRLAKGPQ
jgi:cell division protein FtsB